MTITLGTASYICEPKHIHGGINDIIIGKYCSIAANVTFDAGYGHDYKNVTTFPIHILKNDVPNNLYSGGNIIIESDVWIGMSVTVMSGVTIHNGAIVGTNSTVRRDIAPYEIYTGSKQPEKFRFRPEIIERLLTLAWWDWPYERVLANMELMMQHDIERFLNEHV
jgi:virginiamycin A acetyltransferase